ncbi:MAG: polysaccharide deacetylase family protein [Microcoleaceae cyanobacterium]
MLIRGWRKVKRWSQRRWMKIHPHALILLYHRVTVLDSDPQLLSVSPQNFAEHLQILSKSYHLVSLRELVKQLCEGQVKHHSVAITFDDGYADNLHEAKPLLEKYGIPATVFVTAGKIGQNQEFWWDDLERILLKTVHLPEKLALTINSQSYNWELGESAHLDQITSLQYLINNWNVVKTDNPTPRHQIYRSLCSLLGPLSTETRGKILQEIVHWAQIDSSGRLSHRALTETEVQQLAKDGLVEVGAHSINHPVLSSISQPEQELEIHQSRKKLESILGHSVTSFAYPYGTKSDYNSQTVATVKNLGFDCACSNFAEVVWRGSDRFELPRFLVRNWNGEKFAEQLKGWFNG